MSSSKQDKRARLDSAFFRHVASRLAPDGRLVLLEHLRDLPNALASGPGGWHFLLRSAYITTFADAGLSLLEERAMTPFLRLFVLAVQSPER